MDQVAELTKIQQISSMTQEEVRIFANTVSMAQLGKLNPDQITTETLSSILEFVKLATRTRKLVCSVQSTGDIFAMPMSTTALTRCSTSSSTSHWCDWNKLWTCSSTCRSP